MKLTAEAIAGLFGVEVGEEFLLDGKRCKVCQYGSVMIHTGVKDGKAGVTWSSMAWHGFAGMEITKLPWEPKEGETFYYPAPHSGMTNLVTFMHCQDDQWRLSHGLCFKTREEAVAKWRELYGVTE